VNTSEDTKCATTVVAETLKSLSEQARVCHEKIDLLEAGQNFNRTEVLSDVARLLDACQNLRDAILSEDASAAWTTKSELSAVVTKLDEAAGKRRRYLDLAQVLSSGTVSHRRERTRIERLTLRDKAVAELMEISGQTAAPELPGPAVETWLAWACSLEDDANEPELQKLKSDFPRLDDFVRQMEMDWWHNGPAPDAPLKRPSLAVVTPISTIGSNGTHLVGNGNGNGTPVLKQPVVEEPPVVLTPVIETPAEVESTPVVADDVQPADVPVVNAEVAHPAFAQEEVVELPSEALSPSIKGKVSLFPWDQVEQFTRHIEKSKVERRDLRTVRALLAVSHWLEPRDQNPMTHPRCGIRALTGYPATSEPVYVAPGDAMQLIAEDDGLPLLTGGADLLRWGLLQPSDRNFQGIASVRRLTVEHLKTWFSEMFRIALSDKQIDDIFSLTSGIPYLVGELHKLIIPFPEDPPTWLGLARWMDIKAQFEKTLPEYAHELKKGVPALRLTDREISLLNMVMIVSADSIRDTIVANLSENWEKYKHPEYRPLSSRDEISLAVLLELGLLPRRNVKGVEASRALVPVRHDDAIRKLVEHL